MRIMLKSKIHRAKVTKINIDYEGSIAIDRRLMQEADILPYEQVQVLNINNGARFTTYAIEGKENDERNMFSQQIQTSNPPTICGTVYKSRYSL